MLFFLIFRGFNVIVTVGRSKSHSRSKFSILDMSGLCFVDRNSDLRTLEEKVKNKFKWSWLDEKDTHGDLMLSSYYRIPLTIKYSYH